METIRFVLRRRVGEAKLLLGQQLVHLNPNPPGLLLYVQEVLSIIRFYTARRNVNMDKTSWTQSTHTRYAVVHEDCLAYIYILDKRIIDFY